MIRALSIALVLMLAACMGRVPLPPPGASGPTLTINAVEGAPAERTTALTDAYDAAAAARGYIVSASGGSLALRTYLSIVSSSAGTLLIYVTDVTNPEGVRVTRITGQITSTTTGRDPWRVVADSLLAQAITRTFDQLAPYIPGDAAAV